jgi:hypothetical protein
MRSITAVGIAALFGIATSVALAQTATPAKPAAKPAAKSAAKVATKPIAAAEPVVPQALNATQLEIAKRVHTGKAACEFDQSVSVLPVTNHPGHFTLGYKNVNYTMVPEATTTGAVRLEDKKAGVVWLQIANKSMLMNTKVGQRMVDACQHAEQRAFAESNRGGGSKPVLLQ